MSISEQAAPGLTRQGPPPSPVPFVAGIECSHLPSYDADVTESSGHQQHLQFDLGVAGRAARQIRYPIRWPRIEATPGHYDWSDTDKALQQLRAAGLEPIVDLLHHTSHPAWLTDGLRDRRFGAAYVRFVDAVIERYPWIPAYTLLNEPLTTFLMAGHEAVWPPYDSGLDGFARLAANVLPAVAEAAAHCRAGWPDAQHIWVDTCEHHAAEEPTTDPDAAAVPPSAAQATADLANDRRHALLDLVLGHDLDRPRPFLEALRNSSPVEFEVLLGLPRMQIDVLGLDYYWQLEWWYDESGAHCPSPHPVGLAALAEHYADRYDLPVMITETNVRGFPSDRISWLRYVLEQCELAGARGVDLRGLCWYPLVDSCDWDSLLARNAGRVDPVGVWSLDPGPRRERRRSIFTQAWENAAAGARADDLPAYRFQSPLREQLRGYAPQLAHWPWTDPPGEGAPSGPSPAVGKETRMTRKQSRSTTTPSSASSAATAAPAALSAGAQPVTPPSVGDSGLPRDLLVLSHLPWTWVWQRPQHLISRLAATRHAGGGHTWFVEEPVFTDRTEPALRTEPVSDAITRVWLDVPTPDPKPVLPEFDMPVASTYPERLASYLREARGDAELPLDAWLYSPMAYPLLSGLTTDQIVYDVMDDLSSFAFAPAGMRMLFQRLLNEADLVFSGGRSLHRSVLNHRRERCHLFPSGVDTAHYAESMRLRQPHPKPVAGYVGVLDERIDLELLAGLAAALPDWTIRAVGPVIKIDPADLPSAPNLEYPGQVSYGELPAAMAGFDVALMPFALNEATRSISPTKTLEYLAAGLPVVSTRVPDVVADFSDLVTLADTATEFADACRAAQAGQDDVSRREVRLRRIREQHEWDVIAAGMAELMAEQRGAASAQHVDAPVRRKASA